jgi:putative ABC transport system permease protein
MGSRRAMGRWGWRLLRREWRQALVLGLVAIAIALTSFAVIAGTNAIEPIQHHGAATHEITLFVGRHTSMGLAKILTDKLDHPAIFSARTVRQNGSIHTFQVSDRDLQNPLIGPEFRLTQGKLPVAPGEVAMTRQLFKSFNVDIGDTVAMDGKTVRAVGRIEDPSDLHRWHVVVPPGGLNAPTEVHALVEISASDGEEFLNRNMIGEPLMIRFFADQNQTIRRAAIALAISIVASVAMLEVGLLCAAGFAVIGRRRIRQFGLLGAIGARERQIRQAMALNGLAVGLVGGVIGVSVGFGMSLLMQSTIEEAIGARIGFWNIPWPMTLLLVAMGSLTSTVSAWWPARAISKRSIVESLAARRPQPRKVRRTAAAGLVASTVGAIVFRRSVATNQPTVAGGSLVVAILGILLLTPAAISQVGKLAARLPLTPRIAARDLARHQGRSAAAVAALTVALGIPLAVTLAGTSKDATINARVPNLPANVAIIRYAATLDVPSGDFDPIGPQTLFNPTTVRAELAAMADAIPGAHITEIFAARDPKARAHQVTELTGLSAEFRPLLKVSQFQKLPDKRQPGTRYFGSIWVATPQLLTAWNLNPALAASTSALLGPPRPGLVVTSDEQLPASNVPSSTASTLGLRSYSEAAAYWVPQRWVAEHHYEMALTGWMIDTPDPITIAQHVALLNAAGDHLTLTTMRAPELSSQLRLLSLIIGSAIAFSVLAFVVALVRSEASEEKRIFIAAGAQRRTRRRIGAATAFLLAATASVLAIPAGYLGLVAVMADPTGEYGLVFPIGVLTLVCVGFPTIAAAGAWLLTGRTTDVSHRQT